MPDKITRCIEEEYSFCVSYLWRRSAGWRPLFIYFRGPAGVPFFIAPFLSIAGLWRFTRRPRRLADHDLHALEHAVVTRTCSYLGSYGMGGPGFVGIRLRPASGGRIWVVFTLWAAAGWLTLDDALLEDGYFANERSDSSRCVVPIASLVGARFTSATLTADAAELAFAHDGTTHLLRLQRDSSHLPVHRGSKQPKMLLPTEDIRDAVIVSPRGNLWLED